MIRFRIGDQYLELASNAKFSFKRTNNLFAFADMELSRSASFAVPASPHNNAIFAFANDERMTGAAGRVRHNAVMEYSGGSVNGYLYITSSDKTQYQCCFVFSDMLKWKEIKEAGNISEYLTGIEDRFIWDGRTYYPGYATTNYATVLYYRPDGLHYTNLFPSANLYYLLSLCASYWGVTLNMNTTTKNALNNMRIIPAKLNGGGIEVAQTFKKTILNDIDTTDLDTTKYFNVIKDFEVSVVDCVYDAEGIAGGYQEEVINTHDIAYFQAKTDMKIRFADDFPTNIIMLTPSNFHSWGSQPKVWLRGYGDYGAIVTADQQSQDWEEEGWHTQIAFYGVPLAGRSITLNAGDTFTFFNAEKYTFFYKKVAPTAQYWWNRWHIRSGWIGDATPFSYDVSVVLETDATLGEYVYLQNNLPNVTFLDLLKTAAFVNGMVLLWNEDTKMISFSNIDFAIDDYIIKNVIKKSEIKRAFGKFAQISKILFDSEEYVTKKGADIVSSYYIKNANLDTSKELYKLPFSEGLQTGINKNLLVADIEYDKDGDIQYTASKDTIGRSFNNGYMARVTPILNSVLSDLCATSTSMKLQLPMYLFQFIALEENRKLLYNGKEWVWTSIQWSDNVATIEISQL